MNADERYDSDLNFIGPPVGWFGTYDKIMTHVSILGRFVNATHYAEGLVRINGIGERFDMKRTEVSA